MAEVKRINLALQGGGAHGAFTWGVLDRLLEEERLEIAGISGTSAGALNGAAFKAGWLQSVRGAVRFRLIRLDPLELYASPVNFDARAPLFPISPTRFLAWRAT